MCGVILLVEDEIIVRLALADEFRDEGYEVVEASDGDEALVLFQTLPRIDLVVTDIRMPGSLDGLALTRHIKREWPSLPVVLVSSHLPDEAGNLHDCLVLKPFFYSEMKQVVAELMEPAWKTTSERRNAS